MELESLTFAQLRSIVFEGRALPRSVSAISLLAVLAAKTDRELAAWLASFPDCRGFVKSAPSIVCFSLAARAQDLMLDHREAILSRIQEKLAPVGLEAKTTYGEWITALQQISELAAQTEDDCEWIAPANPGEAAIVSKQLAAMRRYLGGMD